jgi:cation:H+ antiporter
MLPNLIIFILSFIGIWIGSGLAIKSVERISGTLRMSSFAVSFLVLGFFTSLSEFSVGINSIIKNDPEIFVGNVIGASIVIFMLIIPLLALTGKKINITPEFRGFNLPASLIVISLPVLLVMDGKVSKVDSIIAILMFGALILAIQFKKGFLKNIKNINHKNRGKIGRELVNILLGLIIIFIASKFVVEQTVFFSELLGVSPFLISLLIISIGTNVPELSFVVRSAFMKDNQVAFGDYVGSASFNTFLLGLLTLIYGGPIFLSNSYIVSLLFLILGLVLFYYFARTKNSISRLEGFILLVIYLLFVAVEIFIHKGSLFNSFIKL